MTSDSSGPKEACTKWGPHWRNLANTTELSTGGGDGLLTNWFDLLFLSCHEVRAQSGFWRCCCKQKRQTNLKTVTDNALKHAI